MEVSGGCGGGPSIHSPAYGCRNGRMMHMRERKTARVQECMYGVGTFYFSPEACMSLNLKGGSVEPSEV